VAILVIGAAEISTNVSDANFVSDDTLFKYIAVAGLAAIFVMTLAYLFAEHFDVHLGASLAGTAVAGLMVAIIVPAYTTHRYVGTFEGLRARIDCVLFNYTVGTWLVTCLIVGLACYWWNSSKLRHRFDWV